VAEEAREHGNCIRSWIGSLRDWRHSPKRACIGPILASRLTSSGRLRLALGVGGSHPLGGILIESIKYSLVSGEACKGSQYVTVRRC
jgi:hypothetical protein